MIALILQFVGGLITLAGKLFDYLRERKLVDEGRTEEQLFELKKQVDAAHRAVQIRNAVERAHVVNPDRVRDDDGFKRPDDE